MKRLEVDLNLGSSPVAVRRLPAPSLAHLFFGCASLAEKTARAKLTYRLSTLLSLASNAFGYSVFLLVWLAVYRQNPNAALVPRRELFPYLVSAFVLNSVLTSSVELRFMQRVRQGLITVDLIRPLGFLPYQMAQACGDMLGNLLFAVPIVSVGYAVFGAELLPPHFSSAFFGAISLVLAFVVNFGISYLIVQASFVLQSGYGIVYSRFALHQVLSGMSAPLVMFPAGLRAVASALPFRHVIETPVSIWLGRADGAALLPLLLGQAAWAALLLLLGSSLLGVVLKRHQIQGG